MGKNKFQDFPFNPAQMAQYHRPIVAVEIKQAGYNLFSVKIELADGEVFTADFTNVMYALGNGYLQAENEEGGVIMEFSLRSSIPGKMQEIYNQQINNQ
jgi:hypothetical protein